MDDLYSLLGRLEPGSTVLDLGCGRGSFYYERCRGSIVAVDLILPDESNRRRQAAYVQADSNAIPLRDASVDVVVSHHTLEHFLDYKTTLSEIRRILSPKGWLWIAVPNGFGFDDGLYRSLFAGGGHVNRFAYQSLVKEVESATQTRLVQSCDLFSSYIYLKKPPAEEQKYPRSSGFLSEIPGGFLTFSVLALNTATRLVDKAFGTRYSQYGWAFVFVRQSMTVETMPSYFNVCRQCGAGNSAEFLKSSSSRVIFGLGSYRCPNCGERNVFVQPPASLQ